MYQPSRFLRSAYKNLHAVQGVSIQTFGQRYIQYQTHLGWNSFPANIYTTTTLSAAAEVLSLSKPRSGDLRTQKLISHLLRILPLKPGVGQYIAIHATLTARNFFLAYFYPSGPFTCIFSKTSPDFFSCVGCS